VVVAVMCGQGAGSCGARRGDVCIDSDREDLVYGGGVAPSQSLAEHALVASCERSRQHKTHAMFLDNCKAASSISKSLKSSARCAQIPLPGGDHQRGKTVTEYVNEVSETSVKLEKF
jgi:hypothetical protein